MKRRWRSIVIALGAGLGLVGLAALLVRVSDLDNFYAACFGLGLVTAGLAVAALYALAQSPSRVTRRASGEPFVANGLAPPVTAVSDAERGRAAWGSVYLAVAALPCLLIAALHYWA
jgi:hypothetical protein